MIDLARWLKANDSLGGLFDDETDELARKWQSAHTKFESALQEATARQVAEDDIGFVEAVEPVQAALAELKTSLSLWEGFLERIKPEIEPLG